MNEKVFQEQLVGLLAEACILPGGDVTPQQLKAEAKARQESLLKSVQSLQESLDYLRLSIKYLVFDLEATRRENQYLRKMLEETSGED